MDHQSSYEELEQRLAELEAETLRLRDSETRYREIFNATNDAIFIHDAVTGAILDVNQTMLDMYGYSHKEVLKLTVDDLSADTELYSQQKAFDLIKKAVTDGPQVFEWMAKKKSGERIWVEVALRSSEIGGQKRVLAVVRDLTTRKQVEEQLAAREAQYRNFVEQSSEGIWRLEFDRPISITLPSEEQVRRIQKYGYVAECNDAFARMYGYSSGTEVTGKRLLDFYGGQNIKQNFQATLSLVEAGYRGENRETREINNKGETIYFLSNAVGILKDEHLEALWGTQRDITDQKKAEEALRESEEKYRALVENINDVVFALNVRGHFTYISPAIERLSGYTVNEIIGQPFDRFVHPDDLPDLMASLERTLNGQLEPFEFRVLHKDGEVSNIRTFSRLLQKEGQTVGVTGVMTDITVHTQAEQALKENEEKYRSIVEHALAGIFTIDDAYRFIYVNDELCRILGYAKNEMIGMDFRQVLTKNSLNFVAERYVRRQRGEEVPDRYELELVRKDGELRFGEMSVTIIKDMVGRPRSMGQLVDITERKLAEEALRENEERYRIITELMSDYAYAYRVEPDGTFVLEWITVEPALRITGYDPRHEIGSSFILYHPEDQAKVQRHVAQTIKGEPTSDDYRIITKAGGLRWVRIDRHPVWDSQEDRVVRFFGVAQDITERKLAEEALRESEQKFRSIVEQASDAIVICDEQGIIVEFNQAAEQFTGRKRRDMLGKYFWDAQFEFIPEENRTPTILKQFRSMGMEALQTGQATWFNHPIEGNIQRPDGTYRHFQQVTFPIRTAKGFMLGSFSRDITERKLAEEALVIKDYAIESSINAIAIADLAANLTYVNPSFLKLWGYDSEEEVLGRPAVSFWSEPEKAGVVVEALQHRNSWQGELGAIRKDGSVFVAQLSASLVLDTSGQPVNMMASFVDITHEKQAIEEREQLIEELEAKNAELERFTYTVSHDLKSPLVTIKGFLGLLENDIVKGDTLRILGDISHIRDAAETMQLLLDDLLELSRIGRSVNPPEEVHLSELARDAVKLLASQIAERGVQVDLHPDLPVVFGDRPRLLEVYQNLIQNAVKFMGHQPEPCLEIGVKEEEGKDIILYVRDNGIGIEPRYQDQVFGLFDRLDPGVEGTGIGLALVKRIVEVHGGRIWVESAGQEQGSTFYFTLPNEPAD